MPTYLFRTISSCLIIGVFFGSLVSVYWVSPVNAYKNWNIAPRTGQQLLINKTGWVYLTTPESWCIPEKDGKLTVTARIPFQLEWYYWEESTSLLGKIRMIHKEIKYGLLRQREYTYSPPPNGPTVPRPCADGFKTYLRSDSIDGAIKYNDLMLIP